MIEGSSARMRFIGLDDVGAGLAGDENSDGADAVEVAGGAHVLGGVRDIGDVGQVDGCAVVHADNQRLVVGGGGDLAIGDDVRADEAVLNLAARMVPSSAGSASTGSSAA